ncbi:hypothetical protein [Peteryoungia ipomoeae]|uniref:Uncharacterized protein n=1 Tax=Peteryoungia ipomoeae TaxID=1210932 RepID=A0A4S8NYZ5_9HYPH|nr:hypothetical protein [Peteryoungia ipomoeae]THV22927.1 hypothetical protein FAA97_09820 [Peteryoungia ipomoeae]
MDEAGRDAPEFAGMPEEIYQDLLKKSRQVSADTALSADEHREIVRHQRVERKQSAVKKPMGL